MNLLKLKCGQVDIREALVKIVDEMDSVAKDKNQSILLQIERGLSYLWADEEKLHQILQNLINNAIKFNRSGGKIRIKAHSTNGEVIFTIILEELIEHVDQVVTHAELAEKIWGSELPDTYKNLKVYINRLRKKVELTHPGVKLISNRPGLGYLLIRPV
ncbi:hypothetical protein X792_00465 [Dehalococcoides mccartyi CG1]|nr:hypothetical protein X792_00465 [Dehalococcoides mccartyi CG1]